MNNILANTQNINELLDWSNPTLYVIVGFSLLIISVSFIMYLFMDNKIAVNIMFYLSLLSIAVAVIAAVFDARYISSQKQQLNTIVSERLHEKYNFEELEIEGNSKSFFGKKVFESDKIDAPKVTVVLNDDAGIVTWRVIGDIDTGEVEFIGDGNTNPEEILKESE